MTKKVIAALILIAAVTVYLTLQEEGDEAFGGILKPIESVRAESSSLSPGVDPLGVTVTGNSVPQTAQSNYGQLVNRVRTNVNGAMDKSVSRSSRH
jgi:hypothetical protein